MRFYRTQQEIEEDERDLAEMLALTPTPADWANYVSRGYIDLRDQNRVHPNTEPSSPGEQFLQEIRP